MTLRVAGVAIAVIGIVMPLVGFAWGLAGGDWWPGPTLLIGCAWLVVAAGSAFAVVGFLPRSDDRRARESATDLAA